MSATQRTEALAMRLYQLAIDYSAGSFDYGEWMARRSEVWAEARTHRVAHILERQIQLDTGTHR